MEDFATIARALGSASFTCVDMGSDFALAKQYHDRSSNPQYQDYQDYEDYWQEYERQTEAKFFISTASFIVLGGLCQFLHTLILIVR